jgi:hypothetical protein
MRDQSELDDVASNICQVLEDGDKPRGGGGGGGSGGGGGGGRGSRGGGARSPVTLAELYTDLTAFRREVRGQMTAVCASVERLVYELRVARGGGTGGGGGHQAGVGLLGGGVLSTSTQLTLKVLILLRASV